MTTITIPKKELKTVIKESVRDVLAQELMKLRALALPEVSVKEQKNIERLYRKPHRQTVKTIEIKL